MISEEGYAKVIRAFIIESRQLAIASRGDPSKILAAFQDVRQLDPLPPSEKRVPRKKSVP